MSKTLISPVDMVTELMAGIVMALTVSVWVFSVAGNDLRPIMIALATIGCNLAWAIFDGILYIFGERATRFRQRRFIERLHAAGDPAAMEAILRQELDTRGANILPCVDLTKLQRMIAQDVQSEPPRDEYRAQDLKGAVTLGTIEVLAAVPIIMPLMLMDDARKAAQISSTIAIVMLSWAGIQVARWNGQSIWLLGVVTPLIGAVLVVICLVLGG